MAKPVKYGMTLTSVGESSEFNNEAGVHGNESTAVVTEAPGDSETYAFNSNNIGSQYVYLANDPVVALSLVKVYEDTNDDGDYTDGVDVQIHGGAAGVDPSTVTLDELLAWSATHNVILRFDDSNAPDAPDRDFNDIVLLVEFSEEGKAKHPNSGRGNNDETNGGETGTNDIDPGNSGPHNNGGDYNGMPDWQTGL